MSMTHRCSQEFVFGHSWGPHFRPSLPFFPLPFHCKLPRQKIQLGSLGERCKLHSGIRGGAPANAFLRILGSQNASHIHSSLFSHLVCATQINTAKRVLEVGDTVKDRSDSDPIRFSVLYQSWILGRGGLLPPCVLPLATPVLWSPVVG